MAHEMPLVGASTASVHRVTSVPFQRTAGVMTIGFHVVDFWLNCAAPSQQSLKRWRQAVTQTRSQHHGFLDAMHTMCGLCCPSKFIFRRSVKRTAQPSHPTKRSGASIETPPAALFVFNDLARGGKVMAFQVESQRGHLANLCKVFHILAPVNNPIELPDQDFGPLKSLDIFQPNHLICCPSHMILLPDLQALHEPVDYLGSVP